MRPKMNMLVVTAIDESHRLEAHGLIRSVQRILAPMLVFNLGGIPAARLAELRSACGVRVRTFQWQRWAPSLDALGPQRRLYGCGWKPTVIRLALEAAGPGRAVLWADASVRLTDLAAVELASAATFGVAARYTVGTVREYTSPAMVTRWEAHGRGNGTALGRAPSRASRVAPRAPTSSAVAATAVGPLITRALNARMLAATILLWPGERGGAAVEALRRWERCCLDPACFAPSGARGQPCPGCHRYDQSALNLALHTAGMASQAQRASAHIAAATRTVRGAKGSAKLRNTTCPRLWATGSGTGLPRSSFALRSTTHH